MRAGTPPCNAAQATRQCLRSRHIASTLSPPLYNDAPRVERGAGRSAATKPASHHLQRLAIMRPTNGSGKPMSGSRIVMPVLEPALDGRRTLRPHHGLGTTPLRLLAGPSCASWRQSPARASDLWTAPSRTKPSWPCFFPAATAAPRDRFPAKNAPTPVLRCASAENGSAGRPRP